MGSISTFITRQLPSAVTGTLGVDPSAGKFGEAIAAVGAQVAESGFQALQERKATLDIVESQATIRKYEAGLSKLTAENREKFIDDPEAGVEQFNIDGEKLLSDTLKDIKDPNIRRLFANGGSQVLRGQTNSSIAWASKQQIVNAAGQFNEVINMDAAELKQNPSPELYKEKMAILESKKGLIKHVWGTNSGQQTENSKEALSKGMLHGLMETNPLEGRDLLKEGFFNGALNTTEQAKFTKQMESAITGWREKLELDAYVETLQKYGGVEKLWVEGNLDIAAVNAFSNEMESTMINDGKGGVISLTEKFPQLKEINADLLKIAAENTDINTIENIDVINKIADNVRRLNISPDKRTADADLAELIKVRGEIIKAVANGQMLTKQAEGFLNQLTTPMLDQLSQARGKKKFIFVGKQVTPENAMYDSTNRNIAMYPNLSTSESEEMKANVTLQALEEINKRRARGEVITNESAIAIAGKFQEEEWAKMNPALANIPKEGKGMQLRSGQKLRFHKGGVIVPIN